MAVQGKTTPKTGKSKQIVKLESPKKPAPKQLTKNSSTEVLRHKLTKTLKAVLEEFNCSHEANLSIEGSSK